MTKSSPAFPADEALLQILCSLASNPMYKSGWDRINLIEEDAMRLFKFYRSVLVVENAEKIEVDPLVAMMDAE